MTFRLIRNCALLKKRSRKIRERFNTLLLRYRFQVHFLTFVNCISHVITNQSLYA